MFTGLIQDIGLINSVEKDGDWKVLIETKFMNLSGQSVGASIACDGVCLTMTEKGPSWFVAEISGETLSKTTLSSWEPGGRVNLERSLKLGDELGGHIVSGHVDGVGELIEIRGEGDSHRIKIRAPEGLSQFIAPKGSIAVNGISLTVNEVEGNVFGVNIIAHTWEHTTLGQAKPGDKVNLEIDMLARYVARMLGKI